MRPLTDDPIVRELVNRSRAAVLTRRTMLSGAAAAGAALALAACSTTTDAIPGAPGKDHSSSVKQFAWHNWPRSIDGTSNATSPSLRAFTSSTGIQLNYLPDIEGNDAYYASVKTQLAQGSGIGSDAVTLTDWMVQRWIGLGYAQALDHSQIPNLKNLDKELQDSPFDPGRTHSVPWNTGLTGLAWNTDEFPSGLFEISDLWDKELKGKVGVLADMRDTVGLIMLSLGTDVSSSSWGDDQFANAIDQLEKNVHNGQIQSIKGSDYVDDLRKGKTVGAMAWSGDIDALNAEAGRKKFAFGVPGSGGTIWTTNTLIPVASQEKTNVEKLMNYYLEPDVAAAVAAKTSYMPVVTGVKEAIAKIDPALASNQSIFPAEKVLARTKRFRQLSSAEQTRYYVQFQGVLLAG